MVSLKLKPIFTKLEPELAQHLIALSIGYEDLRLELNGLNLPFEADPDRIGSNYEYVYYLRRSILTCREIAKTLINLDSQVPSFVDHRDSFDLSHLALWTEAVEFYQQKWRELKALRDLLAAHLNAGSSGNDLSLGKAILDQLDYDDVGAFEIWQSTDRLHNGVKLHYADTLMGVAFRSKLPGETAQAKSEHIHCLMDQAFKFAEQALKVLTVELLMPSFKL